MEQLRTPLGGWLLAGALLCGIVGAQVLSDTHQPPPSAHLFSTYSPAVLRVADLGLNTATASLLWLGVIQNVGSPGSFLGLANNIETINALDPKFAYPYAFGVLMIPMMDQQELDAAIAIGKQGIAENLGDWHIPYYLATTYHLTLRDTTNAAKYFTLTANTPGVPEGVRISALNYGTRTDLREQTKAIWTAIYENSGDEVVREQAKNSVEHIDILELLDQAIAAYHKTYDMYPKTLDELVRAGILTSIPRDPFGIQFGTDGAGKLTFSLPQ